LLLGKWFGFCGMLTAYIAIMVGGVNTLTYAFAGVTARHLARGLLLMWMGSVVLPSVTSAFATYLSTLTTGVLTLGSTGCAEPKLQRLRFADRQVETITSYKKRTFHLAANSQHPVLPIKLLYLLDFNLHGCNNASAYKHWAKGVHPALDSSRFVRKYQPSHGLASMWR